MVVISIQHNVADRRMKNPPGQEMARSVCCSKHIGIKKGPWSPDEDHKLVSYIQKHGHKNWRALPSLAGLNRCGKACRLRWKNYLRSDINRGKFSPQEEQTIIKLHAIWGNKWSTIASILPGRTDNDVKNFWNTRLKKKLIRMGIDPVTHRPRTEAISSQLLDVIAHLTNLTEILAATKSSHYNHNQIEQNNKVHFLLHPPHLTNGNTVLELEAAAPPSNHQPPPESGDNNLDNPMFSLQGGPLDDLSSSSFPLFPDLFPHLPTSSCPNFQSPTAAVVAQHGGATSSTAASTSELGNNCDFIDSSSAYWTALLS